MASSRAKPGKNSAVQSLLNREKRRGTAPSNPFNKVSSVPKRQVVLGRKIKGADRNVTASRTKAIHSRLQRLQDEFSRKQENKINQFVDNRFGQFNPSLTDDQKKQIRFEQERRKHKQLYNLDDDNSGGEITHFGAALSSVLQDEANDAMHEDHELQLQIDRDRELMAEEARRGAPRSRQEILQEVIMKSKDRKADAALAKEQDTALIADLDAAWRDLRPNMAYVNYSHHAPDPVDDRQGGDDDDDFEVIARQLSTQAAGAASDRTLTEAEQAARQRQKLEQLEQARLERMSIPNTKAPVRRSVEDLSADSVEIDPEFVLQDSDQGCSDVDRDDYELVLSEPGNDDTQIEIEIEKDSSHPSELPFVIEVPDNVQELIALGESDATRLATVLDRVRSCNHASLHPDNSIALQRFFRMLLQYLRALWSGESPPRLTNTVALSDALTTAIGEMAVQFPRLASDSILQNVVSRIEACLCPIVDLPVHTLIELQLAMQIFSISDYVHACVTPIMFAVTSYLSALQIRNRTMTCLGRSIFLCDILLQYVQQSSRFVPELLNHLALCLKHIVHKRCEGSELGLASLFPDQCCISLPAFMPLLRRAFSLHEHLASYPELISQFLPLLDEVKDQIDTCQLVATAQSVLAARIPLVINRNPPMIRQRDPVVHEDFVPGKSREQDVEKRHQKALMRKLKSEKKGARRELRRDAQFIENERRQLIEKKSLAKKQRLNETKAFLENLQRDTNLLRLPKRKK